MRKAGQNLAKLVDSINAHAYNIIASNGAQNEELMSGTISRIPIVCGDEEIFAGGGDSLSAHDPATGMPIAEFACAGPGDVDRAVDAARRAFEHGPWRKMRPFERGRIM